MSEGENSLRTFLDYWIPYDVVGKQVTGFSKQQSREKLFFVYLTILFVAL